MPRFYATPSLQGSKTPAVTGLSFGLENQRDFTGTVGSNPTLSALKAQSLTGLFYVQKPLQVQCSLITANECRRLPNCWLG